MPLSELTANRTDVIVTSATFATCMPAVKTVGKLSYEGKKRREERREKEWEKERGSRQRRRTRDREREEVNERERTKPERGREPKRDAYKLVYHHALHSYTLLCVLNTLRMWVASRIQSPWQRFFLYGYQSFKGPTCAVCTSHAWFDQERYGFLSFQYLHMTLIL